MRFILVTARCGARRCADGWDSDPPLVFLTAITRLAPLQLSELTNLVVPKGPATLGSGHRDAYCPRCLQEDELRGTIHLRRAWLDAWTLECQRHECLLGRFSGLECKVVGMRASSSTPGPRDHGRHWSAKERAIPGPVCAHQLR
jgi:hypothetical protein